MNLQNQYDYFIKWAGEKNILLLDGEVNSKKSTIVEFDAKTEKGIYDFTSLITLLEGKVIFCSHVFLAEEVYDEYVSYLSRVEDMEVKENFLKLEPFRNKFLSVRFYFVHESAVYVFENSLDEADVYSDAQNAIIDLIQTVQWNEISEEKANEIGREFANHKEYSKAKNRTQRIFLAKKLYPELIEFDGDAFTKISYMAETFYEIEVKPQIEQQLSIKINQLKNEGKTKVVICQELRISKDTLNKYY